MNLYKEYSYQIKSMLNFCSPFFKNIGYFGEYPSQQQFQELVENNFIYFIDLTTLREREKLKYNYSFDIPKYKSLIYVNYSIIDNNIPSSSKLFKEFLEFLITILKKKAKVYIHCRGGHGRSSLIVSSFLCATFLYSPYKAFTVTKFYHENRKNLKAKYKGQICPKLYHQRKFVIDFFSR
jgi:hypothetical protein